MKAHHRSGWLLFALMLLSYGIATLNTRAISTGNYFWLATTDLLLTLLGWTIFKKIGEAKFVHEQLGYVAGGIVGGQLALWCSIHFMAK